MYNHNLCNLLLLFLSLSRIFTIGFLAYLYYVLFLPNYCSSSFCVWWSSRRMDRNSTRCKPDTADLSGSIDLRIVLFADGNDWTCSEIVVVAAFVFGGAGAAWMGIVRGQTQMRQIFQDLTICILCFLVMGIIGMAVSN